MAKKEVWEKVKKYFVPQEFDDPFCPGSGKRIDEELLLKLFELREIVGKKIITHWRAGGGIDVTGKCGHAPKSYHLLQRGAKAVDFHFEPLKRHEIRPIIQTIISIGFGGIGLYYDWEWNGKPLLIGFHVDTRPLKKFQIWKRINGRYAYFIK